MPYKTDERSSSLLDPPPQQIKRRIDRQYANELAVAGKNHLASRHVIFVSQSDINQTDRFFFCAAARASDSSDAAPHFLNFLNRFRGRNNIKEAYQKLAWSELIKGNTAGYKRYLQLCTQRGVADFGSDKNAQEEAQNNTTPEPTLVKARLLFDGAYYQKALELLKEKENYRWPTQATQLEYTYRLGRVLHGMERWDEALVLYRQTITNGRESTYYYACNAALQAGLICEARKNNAQARQFFELCLGMKPSDYKTSLHQAAKAGIGRVSVE